MAKQHSLAPHGGYHVENAIFESISEGLFLPFRSAASNNDAGTTPTMASTNLRMHPKSSGDPQHFPLSPALPRRKFFLRRLPPPVTLHASFLPSLSSSRGALRRLRVLPTRPRQENFESNPLPEAKEESHKDDSLFFVISNLWNNAPPRYKLILSTSLAFVICNMDKVNLSIAIIPMSKQLGWNASTAGLIQSSFFWGYAVSQLPGGWFAKWFTGEIVLQGGVLVWSLATAAVPLVAFFVPGLLFSRFMVGLGEGVSPSAATDLIARTVPTAERSRAVAFVFNGLNVGSVIGLLLAPILIERFGWEYVFYIFGVLGVIWCLGFSSFVKEVRQMKSLEDEVMNSITPAKDNDERIPWRSFFKTPSIWAMIYAHFCGNWGHYCNMAWLPTYFSEELDLDLTNAALVSLLPPLGGMFISGFAATVADHLISKGVDITVVRKLCQTLAFLSPSVCISLTMFDTDLSPWMTVSIITFGLALSSFALGGLYCTHQDISRKYASILLGITNTAGAIPGILGVYLTGYLLDQTHSWNIALFGPCIFFWITGAIIWDLFANCQPQDFEEESI